MSDTEIRDVDTDELKAVLADGSALLVDVREPAELEGGVIPGAVAMPLSAFDPGELPDDRRIIFSCGSGVRSRIAVEKARAAGLSINEHYRPGFKGWVAAGQPVVAWEE